MADKLTVTLPATLVKIAQAGLGVMRTDDDIAMADAATRAAVSVFIQRLPADVLRSLLDINPRRLWPRHGLEGAVYEAAVDGGAEHDDVVFVAEGEGAGAVFRIEDEEEEVG